MRNTNPIAANANPFRQYIMELQHEMTTCCDREDRERIWSAIKQLEFDEFLMKMRAVRWN